MKPLNSVDPDEDELVIISLESQRHNIDTTFENVNHSDNDYLLNPSSSSRDIWSKFNRKLHYFNSNHPRIFASILTLILLSLSFTLLTILSPSESASHPNSNPFTKTDIKSKFYTSSNIAAVATDVGACSDLGKQILVFGGNAMDAAVTSALCLGVLNPASSGLGGGCYILNYDSSTQDVTFIDSRETAGEKAYPKMFEKDPKQAIFGGLAVAIPAELKGLYMAWEKHGSRKLIWKELVLPVAAIAYDFVISPQLHIYMEFMAPYARSGKFPGLAHLIFDNKGELKKVGDRMQRPELAHTLEMIAEHGVDYLYNTMAATLAQEIQNTGGTITENDIKSYKPLIHKPLRIEVFGHVLVSASGSSSGGASISSVLKYMSGFIEPLVFMDVGLYYHRLAEAIKHIFAMRMSLGDPLFVNSTDTIRAMLDDKYLSNLRQMSLDMNILPSLKMYGGPIYNITRGPLPRVDSGTSHISIVDKDGNAVSLTSTINTYFGSGVVSPSTGVVFNNEMDDFAVPNSTNFFGMHPQPNNYAEPGKRPLSSMSPSFVFTKAGKLRIIGGASGGPRIITATLQMYLNIIGRGMDILSAIMSPRIHTQLLPNQLCTENYSYISGVTITLPGHVMNSLKSKNHVLDSPCSMLGYAQFILIDTEYDATKTTSRIEAVSDPRKDGRPAGL